MVTGNANLASPECSNPDNHVNSIQRPVSSTRTTIQHLVTPAGHASRFGLEAVVGWFDRDFFPRYYFTA